MIRVFQDRAARAVTPSTPRPVGEPAVGVDVWIWTLDQTAEEAVRSTAGLTDDERGRAGRFVTRELSARWSCARATLRRILGRYLDAAPRAITFDAGPYGKPVLIPEATPPTHFNLSHSAGMAGLAVSRDGPLGFDIEVRGAAPLEVANDVFSEAELDALWRCSPSDRTAAFYRGWTRKEAFIKAIGFGLSHPLKSFDVTLERDTPHLTRIEDGEAGDWALAGVEPSDGGWFGAVAMQTAGRMLDVRVRDGATVWQGCEEGRYEARK